MPLRLLKKDMGLDDMDEWIEELEEKVEKIRGPGTFSRIRFPLWDLCTKCADKAEKIISLPVRIRVMINVIYTFDSVGIMPACGTDTTKFFEILRDAVEEVCSFSAADLAGKYSEREIVDMSMTGEYLVEDPFGTIDVWIKEDSFEMDTPKKDQLWKVGAVKTLGEKLVKKMEPVEKMKDKQKKETSGGNATKAGGGKKVSAESKKAANSKKPSAKSVAKKPKAAAKKAVAVKKNDSKK